MYITVLLPQGCTRQLIYNSNKRSEVRVLYGEFGARLEFLPLYSPDYKPIEKSFAGSKARTRKKRDLALPFGGDVGGSIELAIQRLTQKAGRYFSLALA